MIEFPDIEVFRLDLSVVHAAWPIVPGGVRDPLRSRWGRIDSAGVVWANAPPSTRDLRLGLAASNPIHATLPRTVLVPIAPVLILALD